MRKLLNFIGMGPVNRAKSVRSSFSQVYETCVQVVHDEARAIPKPKKITKKLTCCVNFMVIES